MTTALSASETRSAALGLAMLDAAGLDPGQRVLDVACGDGDTTLHAARRVGPLGLALGVDDSVPMVELARRRAGEAGLANVGFLHTDARTHRFAPLRFDVVMSQLGVTGLANLARALRPGGRLVFVSRDDVARVGAELTRLGLVPLQMALVDAAGSLARVVAAAARV